MGVALIAQYIVKKDLDDAVLATEGLRDSSNKTEHFSYNDEWVNV